MGDAEWRSRIVPESCLPDRPAVASSVRLRIRMVVVPTRLRMPAPSPADLGMPVLDPADLGQALDSIPANIDLFYESRPLCLLFDTFTDRVWRMLVKIAQHGSTAELRSALAPCSSKPSYAVSTLLSAVLESARLAETSPQRSCWSSWARWCRCRRRRCRPTACTAAPLLARSPLPRESASPPTLRR